LNDNRASRVDTKTMGLLLKNIIRYSSFVGIQQDKINPK
jgi:hypothetical protein